MAGKRKETTQSKFFKERLNKINEVLTKLESEVEKAVSKFMQRGEKSSQVIRKNLDEILSRISSSDFYSKASEKTEELTNDVRQLAEDIVAKVKKFDLKVAKKVFNEVRESFDQLAEKVQSLDLVEKAKDRAIKSRNRLLNVLSIPTQDEVLELSRKVVNLEKKIKTLSNQKIAA